jgi:exosortase
MPVISVPDAQSGSEYVIPHKKHEGPPPVLLVHAFCAALWVLSIATFWGPLRQVLSLALGDDRYSHLIVAPLVSAWLLYWKRADVFLRTAFEWKVGLPVVLSGVAIGGLASLRLASTGNSVSLSLVVLAFVIALAGAFVLCYGVPALRPARFPLLFLLLMVPIPSVLMEKIVFALQVGTSNLIYAMFSLTGTPLFRQGFSFELPGVGIVIAQECSSINSAWALFITGLLVGHFFLNSLRAKVCLSLLTIPIAIFTNSVRIVTIWFLATRVNSDFMTGDLHQNGGILFSIISLFLLLVSLWLLRKLEYRASSRRRLRETPPVLPRLAL